MSYAAPDPRQVELLQLWAESIEAKDRYTASHCARVAEYTEQLGRAMGIEGTQLEWLRTGSMMHDVGKLAVPSAILSYGRWSVTITSAGMVRAIRTVLVSARFRWLRACCVSSMCMMR